MVVLKQVKLVGKNDECPKTGHIGRQKMTVVLGKVKWLTHNFRGPKSVKLVGKKWWDS